ncbi:uncharacterized protein LOC142165508 [Nicotiana tabacum]|uniref:Uncharacterized protein LOC142165508 n=2 Tax=Nicotiana TaxID=4085 RepID=A0AC58S591_TOBAC|nr:PREDICTED: caffeoylshikimate esterase-like [Nicotiana sylvestris]
MAYWYQFKGSHKREILVSRAPAALVAKYSDPLVLHGTADRVTDPLASQDLYNEVVSEFKDIKLYDGFLHDLLFEPEREEIAQDIIDWMHKKLGTDNLANVYSQCYLCK